MSVLSQKLQEVQIIQKGQQSCSRATTSRRVLKPIKIALTSVTKQMNLNQSSSIFQQLRQLFNISLETMIQPQQQLTLSQKKIQLTSLHFFVEVKSTKKNLNFDEHQKISNQSMYFVQIIYKYLHLKYKLNTYYSVNQNKKKQHLNLNHKMNNFNQILFILNQSIVNQLITPLQKTVKVEQLSLVILHLNIKIKMIILMEIYMIKKILKIKHQEHIDKYNLMIKKNKQNLYQLLILKYQEEVRVYSKIKEPVYLYKEKIYNQKNQNIQVEKNIDGKIIPSAEHQHQSNPSIKEVQFRKSISQTPDFLQIPMDNKSMSSSRQRKSCLKRPSFDTPNKPIQKRKSRFESISSNKIDGHVIPSKKRKSIEGLGEGQGGIGVGVEESSDSDNDNVHNIFGSKQYVMSEQLKGKLGLTASLSLSNYQGQPLKGKKSILKKNSSVIIMSPNKRNSHCESPQQDLGKSNMSVKSKKSVVFNCTL